MGGRIIMSEDAEMKEFMKKLVMVITGMSETLHALQDKIELSNRQMALLFKQVEGITAKLGQLDLEVEGEFLKLGKEPSSRQLATKMQSELKDMEQDLENIPADLLDDELRKLIEEDNDDSKKDSTAGKRP